MTLEQIKEFRVYVLECEGGRYYVGLTGNEDNRMLHHFQLEGKMYPGGGSSFTQRFKPLRIVESIIVFHSCKTDGDKPYDAETYIADQYRKIYGETKVYGGKYRLPYMKNIWW